MTVTTGDAVAGELITATWGDQVRADLQWMDVNKVDITGDAITGLVKVVPNVANDPTADSNGVALLTAGSIASTLTVAGGSALLSANINLNRTGPGAAEPAGVGGIYARFSRGQATAIGSITIATATSVAYNTTSDPRTKTTPPATRGIDDAMARAQQLGAAAWVGQHFDDDGQPDGVDYDLVSSHDVEDVAPYAVTGERDAVDDDGNPIWQQVAFSDLVPLLFAALSGALSRIDALEAQL